MNILSGFALPPACRLRVASSIVYFNLLCSSAALSQRSFTSFGALSELQLGYRPLGVSVSLHPDTTVELAVIAPEQQAIRLYAVNEAGRILPVNSVKCSQPLQAILSSDLDGNGVPEYVALGVDGKSVAVYKRTPDGFAESISVLPEASQRLAIADVNHDRIPDIVAFGKNRSGASTLLGTGDGSLTVGPELFADVSLSDLKTTDLNGDGLLDFFLLDWLSNTLRLFYGIGRTVFFEQASIRLPGEPASLDVTPVTRERTVRLAIAFNETPTITVYQWNSLGEVIQGAVVQCPDPPSGIRFADVNGDGFADLISATPRGIIVSLGSSARGFGSPTTFGNYNATRGWALADLDDDRKPDLVLVDRNTRRLAVLANADQTGRVEWPSEYCVGNSPYGLAVHDFDGDGLNDLAVANSGSSSVSILYGKPKGRFAGQQSVSTTEYPQLARVALPGRKGENTLVVSHSTVDKISVIHLRRDIARSESFSIPTASLPAVVLARQDSVKASLEILVRNKEEKNGTVSLSSFEQLSGEEFLERSIRSNLPNRIVALTVDDLLGSGKLQLVYATHDHVSRWTNVSMALSDAGPAFSVTRPLVSYQDSSAATRSLVTGFVNGDAFKDIISFVGPPRNALAILYGRGDGTFRDSVEWVRNVHPLREDAFVVQDVNNDGTPDITFVDTARKAVLVLYGQDGGGFKPPVAVCPAEGVNSIRVTSLRRGATRDLVLSNTAKGVVSILFEPFRR